MHQLHARLAADQLPCTIIRQQLCRQTGVLSPCCPPHVPGAHEQGAKLRIDAYLSVRLPGISRSRLKEAIQHGKVHVNDVERRKPAHPLRAGDTVSCSLPEPRITTAEPEDIPIDLVHEDDSVIVVNKAAGMYQRVRFASSRLHRSMHCECQCQHITSCACTVAMPGGAASSCQQRCPLDGYNRCVRVKAW